MAERKANLLRDLSEACRPGAKAEIQRLCLALSRRGTGAKSRRVGRTSARAPSLKDFQEWLETLAAKGGMSVTCWDCTVTAAELVETYEGLGFESENVRREAKDDIKRVVRRLKRSQLRGNRFPR